MRASSLSLVEINENNLSENIRLFKNHLGKNVEFAPVIKSNAYGHGLREVVGICLKNGVSTFCVASLEEALLVRELSSEARIICLGYVSIKEVREAVGKSIELTVFNEKTIEQVSKQSVKQKKKSQIHLKVETGTNRQGFLPEKAIKAALLAASSEGVMLRGVSTHFANIEDTTEHEFAIGQMKIFAEITKNIKKVTKSPIQIHNACSAATILFPETHNDLVRVGISLYGIWPSKETFLSSKISGKNFSLKPVLSWKTIISQVKTVEKGSFVGYGCTYKTSTKSKLAYIPIGYYDGYDRSLSNIGWVLVRGKRAPVRGRVCMNVVIIDVTDIKGAKLEDEVVLLGRQGDEVITAEIMASLCGTINYEILSRINPLIKRNVI
ncbi:alanine racemase [candidate division WOR-3 bacterium]|nr:alanine racemase [candidate division WOR-3 bacterium]